MKLALLFLIAGIVLLATFLFNADIWLTKTSIDIHVHDTYFIIAYSHFALLLLLLSLNFFSLGGIIGTKFKNKPFLFLCLIALSADGFLYWQMMKTFRGL